MLQPTERSAVVQLDHGRPLVRVEEVDDGDGQADHEAEGSRDYDEPEAPAELEGELRTINGILDCHMELFYNSTLEHVLSASHHYILNVDAELPVGQHPVVDGGGEEHGEAGEGHGVSTVPRDHHHEHVHDQPEDERSPQEDGGVVASRPAFIAAFI